jgi:hypothetical protein
VMMHFVKQTNQAMHGRVQYSRRTSWLSTPILQVHIYC